MNDLQKSSPQTPAPARFDDEIDLVDLGLALWRHRLLILAFVVLGLVLGLLAAQFQGVDKKLSAVVMVGQDSTEGEKISVASTETVAGLLNTSLLPANASKHGDVINPDDLTIQARSSEGETVTISGSVDSDTFSALATTVRDAVDELAVAIDNPLRSRVDSIESSARQLELKLESLTDEDRVEQQRTKIQQQITNKENELANREDDQAYLESEIQRLNRMIELQTAHAAELEEYLEALRGDVTAISATSPTEAMTAMLLGNQVQSYVTQLNRANEQITVELPGEISEARTELAKAEREQAELQSSIAQARLELKKFDRELEREAEALKAQLKEERGLLENIQFTSLLNEPQMRTEQGTGTALFAALGLILGGFLGLFAALMANFVAAARNRLRDGSGTQE